MTALTATVTLGPLTFATLRESVTEQLGDTLETIGPVVRPGERRARPFKLVLPVRGMDGDPLKLQQGQLLRRQVRALMENTPAKMQGLWFSFQLDPELSSWLLVSTADLEDDPPGAGLVAGEWKLSVEGYRVAATSTHREARRLEAFDRRLATTPLDTLGTVFGSGFVGTARTLLPLPNGATDLTIGSRSLPQTVTGSPVVVDLAAQTVVSFERDPLAVDAGEVTVKTVTGDLVVGPGQIPAGEAPVLSNAQCTVRWVADRGGVAVNDASGTETVRIIPVAGATVAPLLLSARLLEATTERAVVAIRVNTGTPSEVIVTLQRGWFGPRVELYAGDPVLSARLRVAPAAAGAVAYTRSGDSGGAPPGSASAFTGMEPWAHFAPASGANLIVSVARASETLVAVSDSLAYPGAARTVPEIAGLAYTSVYVEPVAAGGGATRRAVAGRESLMDARGFRELVSR